MEGEDIIQGDPPKVVETKVLGPVDGTVRISDKTPVTDLTSIDGLNDLKDRGQQLREELDEIGGADNDLYNSKLAEYLENSKQIDETRLLVGNFLIDNQSGDVEGVFRHHGIDPEWVESDIGGQAGYFYSATENFQEAINTGSLLEPTTPLQQRYTKLINDCIEIAQKNAGSDFRAMLTNSDFTEPPRQANHREWSNIAIKQSDMIKGLVKDGYPLIYSTNRGREMLRMRREYERVIKEMSDGLELYRYLMEN